MKDYKKKFDGVKKDTTLEISHQKGDAKYWTNPERWTNPQRTAVSVAVALRAARTALGWGQQEFADRLGVAKSTIARIETAESSAKVDLLLRAKEILKEAGIEVDFLQSGSDITLVIQPPAIDEAGRRLFDDEMRRIDRKQEKKG